MKELRLGLQIVGRKLAIYVNRRKKVRQEGERREIFLRYLGEVASAVGMIKDYDERPRKELYGRLVDVAKRKTAIADTELNDKGKKVEEADESLGDNVLIVNPE
jgi:DNA topoisomerase-6 subunit B